MIKLRSAGGPGGSACLLMSVLAVLSTRPTTTAQDIELKFDLPATPLFVDTSISITAGRVYEIHAAGKWTNKDGESSTANGIAPKEYLQWLGPPSSVPRSEREKLYLGQHPRSSLVGKIGEESWDFFVGESARFLAPASGHLHMKMNDVAAEARQRSGRLSISVREVPNFRWVGKDRRVEIVARFDTTDWLHLTPEGLRWRAKGNYKHVGDHNGYYPTVINGTCWWPKWIDQLNSAPLLSEEFVGHGQDNVSLLSVTAERGRAVMEKNVPGETVIQFKDGGLGSSTIRVTLIASSSPLRRF